MNSSDIANAGSRDVISQQKYDIGEGVRRSVGRFVQSARLPCSISFFKVNQIGGKLRANVTSPKTPFSAKPQTDGNQKTHVALLRYFIESELGSRIKSRPSKFPKNILRDGPGSCRCEVR
ncbi:Uncharacterized protein HZ326_9868 [Fusarium oxysporum f. sp. albedinis]|nr:Uncharacterized protein HZ326_9868 [Fusarium oxysporum f. sp. albedinis]